MFKNGGRASLRAVRAKQSAYFRKRKVLTLAVLGPGVEQDDVRPLHDKRMRKRQICEQEDRQGCCGFHGLLSLGGVIWRVHNNFAPKVNRVRSAIVFHHG